MADRNLAIVTTGGTDGAACAAAMLLKDPEASIWVTSKNHGHHTLSGLASQDPLPARTVVCGVGVGDNAPEVFAALAALREAGVEVTWVCGRGYLDALAGDLAAHCQIDFRDAGSNTTAVIDHAGLGRHAQAGLLAELGRQYADGERGDGEQAFFHDLVQAASDRYFQFGDVRPFLRAVRKLAGLSQVTCADREEVDVLRKTGPRKVSLGTSPAMKRLRDLIGRVAPLDEPVLILGPSGAGKELVARALHNGSPRRGGPFLPINCALLGANEQLAADKLFGHTAGAFTGASRAAKGAFEAAAGGTLFLDELAELPPNVQTQLLRVLEERTITPLGTHAERPVDIRLVAATNRDLPAEVGAGTFRLDLYHRLNVLCLEVPPLKDRLDDLRSIAGPVLKGLAARGYAYKLTREDVDAARAYEWPGNVRQFVNLLRRAALMGVGLSAAIEEERQREASGRGSTISLSAAEREALSLFLPEDKSDVMPESEVKRVYYSHVLALFDGNVGQAASALGVAANTVRKWAGRT